MQHEIPEHKVCPRCGEDKASSEFYVNSSRVDGLTYYCKLCVKAAANSPSKKPRAVPPSHKECDNCLRDLPIGAYSYARPVRDNCRTCESFRMGMPTVDQVIAFEEAMDLIIAEAKTKVTDLELQRSEFEQVVYKLMLGRGLLTRWKPPVWIHKTSIPE